MERKAQHIDVPAEICVLVRSLNATNGGGTIAREDSALSRHKFRRSMRESGSSI